MRGFGASLSHRVGRTRARLSKRIEHAAASALHASGAMRLSFQLLRRIDPTRRVVVLIYHKVIPAEICERVNGVGTGHFESQVRVMRDCFDCVSADDAVAALEPDGTDGGRYPALVTFDDGYQNTLLYALPILHSWGVPSIVFATTGLVGTRALLWTDEVTELVLQSPRSELRLVHDGREERHRLGDRRSRLEVAAVLKRRLKRMPLHAFQAHLAEIRAQAGVERLQHHEGTRLLTWAALGRLASRGAMVGTHSSRHMILANMPDDALQADLNESQAQLVEHLGEPARYIAYPNGHEDDFDERVCAAARRTGLVYGFTMRPGIATQDDDPMRLPRIAPADEPGELLALRVLRRLATDVAREHVRAWRRRGSPATRPPRLVVVPGGSGDVPPPIPLRPEPASPAVRLEAAGTEPA